MQPESSAVYQEVWNELLEASRTHLYAMRMEKRYRRQRLALRVAMYVGALGVVGSLIGQMGEWPVGICAIEMVVVETLKLWWNPEQNMVNFHQAKMESGRMEQKFRELWFEVQDSLNNLSPQEASTRLRTLKLESRYLDSLINVLDDKLILKCTLDADEVESKRYA